MSKLSSGPNRCTSHPEGPYTTGCLDLMVGKDISGTFCRLYYPTSLTNIDEHRKSWSSWFPGEKYAEGLAKYYLPSFSGIYKHLTNKYTKNAVIPSVWEAPVATETFPVVIFSHGLTAHRTFYSSICNDVASHGFVVAAVEHRDGSACATFTLNFKGKKEWIPFKKIKSNEDELLFRHSQMELRADECIKALDVLKKLNEGEIRKNELVSSFDIKTFQGRLDLSQPVLAGHSFGGATTILTLSMDKRFSIGVCLDPWMFPLSYCNNFQSLPTQSTEVSRRRPSKDGLKIMSEELTQPILFIMMDGFQDKRNIQEAIIFKNDRNVFKTILGTVHQNQIDTPFLFEKDSFITRRFIGCTSKRPHDQAMMMNNRLIISFLCKKLNIEKDFVETYDKALHNWIPMIVDDAIGTAKSMVGWSTYRTRLKIAPKENVNENVNDRKNQLQIDNKEEKVEEITEKENPEEGEEVKGQTDQYKENMNAINIETPST